jgi:hypothetical protein
MDRIENEKIKSVHSAHAQTYVGRQRQQVKCKTHGLQSPLLMKGTKPRSCYQL